MNDAIAWTTRPPVQQAGMSIELHCQGCGKLVRAPRDAAGRRVRCPGCGRELYVPTPREEIEELPLSPEDTDLLTREAALQAERRRVDSILRRDSANAGESLARRTPPHETRSAGVSDLVVQYLEALSRSDLAAADQVLPALQRSKSEVFAWLDRLAGDQIPPAGLSHVPPGVYQGFLKHLRSQM